MEEDYNWKLILKVAIPLAAIEATLFYLNIINFWKWISLIGALLLAGAIVYVKDKKRSSVFTAIGIVFLAALAVKFLKEFGII